MASTPTFTSALRCAAVAISTANTNRDGTGTISAAIVTAPAAGMQVFEIDFVATADPADSTVTLFLHDGSSFWYFDEVDLGNPAAGSATVAPFRARKTYDNLLLPSGWSVRAAITVTLTAGVVNVLVFGADLT